MFPLAALADPPQDLVIWVGGIVLAALGSAIGAVVTRVFSSGDKEEAARLARIDKEEAARKAADAEWKAELKGSIQRLLDGQQALGSTVQLQGKDLTMLATQFAGLDKRQDAQATSHKESQWAAREESRAAVTVLRDEMRNALAAMRTEFNLRSKGEPA